MPSFVPGYEYDIFISYRHNDNRSGWVTEFVNALQEELAATIKEPLSIYFDKNPHDGLLETHNVDKSLEGKLKCLIFIPIISQTYCDPKSFAWQHEFCAITKLARVDQIGRDVKLGNGNVASRILPIKIHDIDAEDKTMIENELGGPLRAIEFIFSTSGVNRPLTPSDNPDKNLNKTLYRDQINKVSNAVKPIISAIKSQLAKDNRIFGAEKWERTEKLSNPFFTSRRRAMASYISIALLLISSITLILFNSFGKNLFPTSSETSDKSIAVLPFDDISEDHDQDYFTDGMMVEILDHLYKIEDLRVIPRTSVLTYKNSPKPLKEIAEELGVATILEGSVRKSANQIKISVQLFNGKNERSLWQQTYERNITDVFSVQSDVAQQIAASLQSHVRPEVKLRIESIPTANQNAYDLYLQARSQVNKFWSSSIDDVSPVEEAIILFRKSIDLDPKFSNAYTGLGQSYWLLAHFSLNYTPNFWRLSKENITKALELDNNNGWAHGELGLVQYLWESDREAALKSFTKAVELSPGNLDVHMHLFNFYSRIGNYVEARKELDIVKSIDRSHLLVYMELHYAMCSRDTSSLKSVDRSELIKNPVYHMLKGNYEMVIENFPEAKGFVGEAYAILGNKEMAKAVIHELEEFKIRWRVSNVSIANIYMALGEEDKAYQLLDEALQERDFNIHIIFQFNLSLSNKRGDPRMEEFIRRSWTPIKD